MRVAGIDPGVSPAIAYTNYANGRRVAGSRVLRIPQDEHYCDVMAAGKILTEDRPDMVVLELVGAMASDSVSSAAHLMASWGLIRGLCIGLSIPIALVTPQVWKKKILEADGYDMGRKEKDFKKRRDIQKRSALSWVATNYPAIPLFTKAKGQPDHNIAEAVMMAEWGHRYG